MHFVRNVARVFGLAPPGGTDDDEVWREWWPSRWPSFVPSEMDGNGEAPFLRFKECYIEALKRGDLAFQAPIPADLPQERTPVPPPTSEQIAEICALIEKFRAELAAEPRYGNVQQSILELIEDIRDLPTPSQWSETDLDCLLHVQLALEDRFQRGDSDTGIDAVNFGALAPLLNKLSALLTGRQLSDDYSAVVNDELIHYLNEIREAIRQLATVEMPPEVRKKVKALDRYLEVVEQSAGRRINLKHLDDMAGRIRQHRLGALHRIECLTAVLIGKRTDRAPNWAIFRDELRGGGYGPELVIVRAGQFQMGSPKGEGDSAERPQHGVTIARRIAVGVCPVTRGEFADFVAVTNHDAENEWRDPGFPQDDDHPVVCVNWHDAQAYVRWLTEQSGGADYRLLSEAEWEYCCRAGTSSAYSTGDNITSAQANFFDSNHRGTTSVFKFPPNAWRLRDMHGNVWEWCEDNWHNDYRGNPPVDGSAWSGGDASLRVLRGGSWDDNPQDLRSAIRDRFRPGDRIGDLGFRVARTL